MKTLVWSRLIAATTLAAGALVSTSASAQVPARFYWKSLSGGNAVPLVLESVNGNTNPFDPAHTVTPGANFSATMGIAGYQINDNTALTVGYKSTINDRAPDAMRMDRFMMTLVFGWHPIIEGSKRLKAGN